MERAMIQAVRMAFPEVQAIYLFGSFGTVDQRPESDVDLALLLPPLQARETNLLTLLPLCGELARVTGREVDLINLRRVDTVLQKEVIMADRRIDCADPDAADEFEMLTLSYYGKLNEERAGIIAQVLADGRVLAP